MSSGSVWRAKSSALIGAVLEKRAKYTRYTGIDRLLQGATSTHPI